MKDIAIVLFLLVTISFVKCSGPEDEVHACMIKTLKEKRLLNSDFPYPQPPAMCFLIESVISTMEDGFYTKFDEKDTINADCVKKELKDHEFIYYVLKKEMIETSNQLLKENIYEMLNQNQNDIKKVLNEAAEACHSDSTWAGIFDELLDITNTSKPVLEQNYCYLKTSIDKNLIFIGNFDINPHKIDTSKVDCDAVIEGIKAEIDEKIRNEYQKKDIPNHQIDCVINSFKNSRFYDVTIALESLEKNKVDPIVRGKNKEKLTPQLQPGVIMLFSCFL